MTKPPLILLVDDEADFREIFSLRLSEAGFRVETAESGEAGIKKAESLKPDLVLMDVKMPGLNGIETLQRLKESHKTKDIKVLFLTVLGDPWEQIQELNRRFSQEIGAVDYIKKTDDLDAIVDRVKAVLAQKTN